MFKNKFLHTHSMNGIVNFFKTFRKKLRGFFTKKSLSTKNFILNEKAILEVPIVIEEIHSQIQASNNANEKGDLIKKISEHNTAKLLIDLGEKELETVDLKKRGRKRLYEFHELKTELLLLGEKRAILDFDSSQIKHAEYPDTLEINNRVNHLFALIDQNKNKPCVKFADISISTFNNSYEQLEKLLSDRSVLKKHKNREKERQEKEEIQRNQIKLKLDRLDVLIKQNKLIEAKELIQIVADSIKPNYNNESTRFFKAKEKFKILELQAINRQQDELLKKQAEDVRRLKELERKRQEEIKQRREQEFIKRKIAEDNKKDKILRLNALLNKKSNWRDFQRILQENNITTFYHFTDTVNIRSIKENGGLYSWYYADSNGIAIPLPGGDTFSRELDKTHRLHDYVRVSLCNDHPMQHRLRKKGRNLVLLNIDLEIAYFENTIFSNINATDSNHEHGPNIEDLQRIKFSATQRNYVPRSDPDFKHHQAEILVKTWIPLKYINNINAFA